MVCVYVGTNYHKCAECAFTKKIEKIIKIQRGE